MNIFTLCRKKIHFHVSTSVRANSSGYSDDLCKYYCNSLSVYSQCDGSQFAGVFFVTFALTIFIIINSNNMQQVIIVFKGRNAILCGRN